MSHIMLKSIANSEPPAEEVLVDRPDEDGSITRVTGPFVVEGVPADTATAGGPETLVAAIQMNRGITSPA